MSSDIIYLVVEFDKECGVSTMEVVPDNWRDIEGNQCILYPYHFNDERVHRAARRGEVPTDEWKSFPIRKEWYKTRSWSAANRRCDKLLDTSNVESEEEEKSLPEKRISKLPQRYIPSPTAENQSQDKVSSPHTSTSSSCSYDEMTVPPPPPNAPIMSGNHSLRIGLPGVQSPQSAGQSLIRKRSSAFSSPTHMLEQQPLSPTPHRGGTAASATNAAFERRIFSLFERVLEKLRAHDVLLRGIAERQHLPDEVETNEEELPQLPCESVEAVRNLEGLLTRSEPARKKLTRTLSLVGGHNLKSLLANIMKILVSHPLSKQYNLTAAKGKASFKQHRTLLQTLFHSIRRINNFRNETEQDVMVAMGRWFTNSRDRNGDRKARMESTVATTPNATMPTCPTNQDIEQVDNSIEIMEEST